MQRLSVVNTVLIVSLLHLPCQSSSRDFYNRCPKVKYWFCELSNYVDVEISCFSEGVGPQYHLGFHGIYRKN